MKKMFFLSALSLVIMISHAQFSFGFRAGLNIANQSISNNNYSWGRQLNFNGGLGFNYQFSNPLQKMSLEADVLYSQEGEKGTFVPTGESDVVKAKFVEIPVLVQYNLLSFLYVETGPQLSFLLSQKETLGTRVEDTKSNFRTNDLRWVFGAGYAFKTLPIKGTLGIDARYNFSLSAFNKKAVNGTSIKSNCFNIDLFYWLPTRKK